MNELIDAARDGKTDVVRDLLFVHAVGKIDMQKEGCGYSALIYACFNGHTDIAYLLCTNKAQLDIQGNDGMTALILASREGHSDIVRLLLRNGAAMDLVSASG